MTAPLPAGTPFGFGRGGGTGSGGVVTPPNLVNAQARMGRELGIYLPEVFPIPDAKEFNPLGSIGTAAVQANVAIPNATVDVPASNLFVIRSFSIYITNMLATTNVTWSLLVNGQPVQGYLGVSIFPRVAPSISNTFDCFIRGRGFATISVIFSNGDGGAYTVGASFSGWFWPEASDGRWKSSGE